MGRGESKLKRHERYMGSKKSDKSDLIPGEETLVSMGNSPLVTKHDGKYLFKGYVSDYTKKIDTESNEYKRELREFNVKASFTTNGGVQVKAGPLYSRAKKFKDIDSFERETNRRIDSIVNYANETARKRLAGEITQIHALNIESYMKNHTKSDGYKKARGLLEDEIRDARIKAAAGEDMKRRLAASLENRRKR